jgi:hypothetical protein
MSTNPFRKSSSLKGPGGSTSPKPNLTSDPRGTSPGGLSLDTRGMSLPLLSRLRREPVLNSLEQSPAPRRNM